MSSLEELQKKAEQIRLNYEKLNALSGREAWRIRDYAMGFVGDVGDLQRLIVAKENLSHMDDVDAKLGHEIADCLWSLLVIADYYNIDVSKEFETTLAMIEKRIDEKNA